MDLWKVPSLASILHLTAAREDGATQDIAEATVLKFDSFVSVLEAIPQTIPDSNQHRDLCHCYECSFECTESGMDGR